MGLGASVEMGLSEVRCRMEEVRSERGCEREEGRGEERRGVVEYKYMFS
jgi:hypothetical protein